MGGLIWTISLLLGHLMTLVALILFSRFFSGDHATISASLLWTSFWILESSFILFFAVFIASVDKKFISTFFSTTTAKQHFCAEFFALNDHRPKFDVFYLHPKIYAPIRGDVKQWVQLNWGEWNDGQTEWFTTRAKASVPIDMIPEDQQ